MIFTQKKNNKILALIPARKGSKSLKNKNLRKINKISLVEIAIKNCIKSKLIKNENIFVSSDSLNIKRLATKNSVNFLMREKKYTSDTSTAIQVIHDFIKKMKVKENINLLYLQPSSPLKNYQHIDKAIKFFFKTKANSLISGYFENSEKILKSFIRYKNKFIKPIFDQKTTMDNRQSLPKIFFPNGCIYLFKISFLKKKININKCTFYKMKKNEVVDINNFNDYLKAKKLFLNQ